MAGSWEPQNQSAIYATPNNTTIPRGQIQRGARPCVKLAPLRTPMNSLQGEENGWGFYRMFQNAVGTHWFKGAYEPAIAPPLVTRVWDSYSVHRGSRNYCPKLWPTLRIPWKQVQW